MPKPTETNKTYIKVFYPYERRLRDKIRSKRGPTITVSGPSGSGKTTISKAVAKAMNLKYVAAGQIFREHAKKYGMSLQEFSKFRSKSVDYEMDVNTMEHAMRGNCVIDARLSGWVAGDWADAKIYIHTPTNLRAERVARRDNILKKAALKINKQRDVEDNKKYKKLYKVDLFDTSIYDIIIDNGKLTLAQTKRTPVKAIRTFLKNKRGAKKKKLKSIKIK